MWVPPVPRSGISGTQIGWEAARPARSRHRRATGTSLSCGGVGIVGAELASLTRLEAAVARHGAALEQLRAALAAEIAATEWQGRAAGRLPPPWGGEHQ